MRLGSRRTVLETVDCIAAKLYQSEQYIDERHRHRRGGRACRRSGGQAADAYNSSTPTRPARATCLPALLYACAPHHLICTFRNPRQHAQVRGQP